MYLIRLPGIFIWKLFGVMFSAPAPGVPSPATGVAGVPAIGVLYVDCGVLGGKPAGCTFDVLENVVKTQLIVNSNATKIKK